MSKIALLVPSRERIDKKKNLITSIKKTVDDIDNVKLYLGTDLDDPTREQTLQLVRDNTFVENVDIDNKGKYMNLGVLWNICARASKEEILAMVGDDMIFLSKNWDKEIIGEFTGPKCPVDNFKMVYCYDGRHGKRIAVNAFIHRIYYDINGYFMREEFPVDKVDIWFQQIFKAFDRLVYRGDIHIEHLHWSFRKSAKDNTVYRMRADNAEQVSKEMWIKTLPDRMQEAERISKKLGIMFSSNLINNDLVNG